MANFLWGLWTGITAWPLLIVQLFGGWERFPIFDVARNGGWYQFGFLLGAGSPFFGLLGRRKRTTTVRVRLPSHATSDGEPHAGPA